MGVKRMKMRRRRRRRMMKVVFLGFPFLLEFFGEQSIGTGASDSGVADTHAQCTGRKMG